MINLISKKKIRRLPQPSHKFYDGELECYCEEYFHEMLIFELKRSIRSGRPFFMMTVDIAGIRWAMKRQQAIRDVMGALAMLTRDTDIKGWYKGAAVMGVILTEMNTSETDALRGKLAAHFNTSPAGKYLDALQIDFIKLPSNGEPLATASPKRFILSPDIARILEQHESDYTSQKAP